MLFEGRDRLTFDAGGNRINLETLTPEDQLDRCREDGFVLYQQNAHEAALA